jgi:hypothetical protein
LIGNLPKLLRMSAALIAVGVPFRAYAGTAYDELLPKLRARTPLSGGIEAVFTAAKPGAVGETLVGYHADTRAWYLVTPSMVRGVDPSGSGFAGPPSRLADVVAIGPSASPDRDDLDDYVAQPMLADIVTGGEDRFNFVHNPDGTFTVTTAAPRGRRTLDLASIKPAYRDQFPLGLWELTLDAQGVPLRLQRTYTINGKEQVETHEYKWSPRSPAPWLLAEGTQLFALASFTLRDDHRAFERTAVAAAGVDSVVRDRRAREFVHQSRVAAAGGPKGTTAEPPAEPASPEARRWSRWLLAIGGATLAGGVGVLVVRRVTPSRKPQPGTTGRI